MSPNVPLRKLLAAATTPHEQAAVEAGHPARLVETLERIDDRTGVSPSPAGVAGAV
jgi:hypothetical protein